jgi:three-Cys-motif partner protein
MPNYLLPEEDGLLMRSAGPWAAIKLDYLARYIDVFETAMRTHWPIRNFIDLMAGPGKNRVRETKAVLMGSPLLALNTKFPFTGYYFVDNDIKILEALTQRCNASPNCSKVNIMKGDCNLVVDSIVTNLKKSERQSLNLTFLDPEGLELKWQTVAKIASIRKMDLIINYPQGGLNRQMNLQVNVKPLTPIDNFFGGVEWRTIYKKWQNKKGLHRRLLDLYRLKLENLGYQEILGADEISSEPLIRNTKRAPLYRLLFASKNPLGIDFWKKVIRRDVHGQSQMSLPL